MLRPYRPKLTPLVLTKPRELARLGGWSERDQRFRPLVYCEWRELVWHACFGTAIDHITRAIEKGKVPEPSSAALFDTDLDLADFLEDAEDYEYWLNERHFHALYRLGFDEHYLLTYKTMAEAWLDILPWPAEGAAPAA
jgi:hypothetical protein